MKEELIKELNYQLKQQKKTMVALAEKFNVSINTVRKLFNDGDGKITLLLKVKQELGMK